jgi:hypothetical protein
MDFAQEKFPPACTFTKAAVVAILVGTGLEPQEGSVFVQSGL